MGDRKPRTRAKTKGEPAVVEAGRGVPVLVSQTLKRNIGTPRASIIGNKNVGKRSMILERISQSKSQRRRSFLDRKTLAELSATLGIEEFEFPEEDEHEDQTHSEEKVRLDVSALDRYNDDIRRLRRLCIDECRNFPAKGEPDGATVQRLRFIVRSLCRTTFFGTHKSQVLAEGSVILVVWLLNKTNLKVNFKVHILQSFAEMVWTSEELKHAFFRCNGVKVLVKLLVKGVNQRSDQARWACYTLAMACVGCKEIIDAVQNMPHLDEIIGEVAFHAYWTNWPANFGQILQGIVFGPHSVIPVEDAYQFL